MNREELAVNYKHNGKNCCQAVLLAYKDILNMSDDELLKLGAGFGVGFGSMEATCGALIGANIILGLLSDGKPSLMMESKKMLNEFNDKCGATLCKDLKGRDTGIVLTPCDDCVRCAVEIVNKRVNSLK